MIDRNSFIRVVFLLDPNYAPSRFGVFNNPSDYKMEKRIGN